MDAVKVQQAYNQVRGKKIVHDDEQVYVEDFVDKEGEPMVMLSNDKLISLFEAVNAVGVAEQNAQNFQNQGNQSGGAGPFFPQITYDENGIPSNLKELVATTETEMEEVANKFEGGPGTSPQISLSRQQKTHPAFQLIETAKKSPKVITLEFEVDMISRKLYDVLMESYEPEEVKGILSKIIAGQLLEKLESKISENLDTIV